MRGWIWLLLLAGCPKQPPPASAGCADLTLQVSASGVIEQRYSFASNLLPVIAVNLAAATGAVTTQIAVESCDGQGRVERSFSGGASFTLDSGWYGSVAPAGCHRVAAWAINGNGVQVGAASARIVRGDFQISGDVVGPTDGGTGALPAHVEIKMDRQVLTADADAGGRFAIVHVPAGPIVRIRARLLNAVSDTASSLALSAAQPSASLHLRLFAAAPAVDAFEPDDSIAAVAMSAPIAPGDVQSHSLAWGSDVDFVPFQAVGGRSYLARVTPAGGHGDLSLQLLDGSGALLAHANDTPGSFMPVPSLTILLAADQRVYLRVARADAEPVALPYQLSLSLVGGGP